MQSPGNPPRLPRVQLIRIFGRCEETGGDASQCNQSSGRGGGRTKGRTPVADNDLRQSASAGLVVSGPAATGAPFTPSFVTTSRRHRNCRSHLTRNLRADIVRCYAWQSVRCAPWMSFQTRPRYGAAHSTTKTAYIQSSADELAVALVTSMPGDGPNTLDELRIAPSRPARQKRAAECARREVSATLSSSLTGVNAVTYFELLVLFVLA
jgi:hypothetical protein